MWRCWSPLTIPHELLLATGTQSRWGPRQVARHHRELAQKQKIFGPFIAM